MSVPSQELKNLYPCIQAVADVNAVVLVNVDIRRQIELARVLPIGAHEHQRLAVGAEDLEVVEGGVHHPQVAFFVVGHAFRTNKLARTRALPSDAAHELTFGRKHLYRATAGVGNCDAPVRSHRHGYGKVEFALLSAALA